MWILCQQRVTELMQDKAATVLDITALSRQKRQMARNLRAETSALQSKQQSEIYDVKQAFDKVKKSRPNVNSEEYAEWEKKYAEAKEKYDSENASIKNYYDDLKAQVEADAKELEEQIDEEKTEKETYLEEINQEIESVKSAMSEYAKNSAPQLV